MQMVLSQLSGENEVNDFEQLKIKALFLPLQHMSLPVLTVDGFFMSGFSHQSLLK